MPTAENSICSGGNSNRKVCKFLSTRVVIHFFMIDSIDYIQDQPEEKEKKRRRGTIIGKKSKQERKWEASFPYGARVHEIYIYLFYPVEKVK